MRKEFSLILLTIALCFNSCAAETAQKDLNQTGNTSKQNNSEKIESNKSRVNTVEQQKSVSQQLNCADNIKGLSKSIVIPKRLCFDSIKPIDKSQILPARRSKTDDPNIYDEQDVEYSKLPSEVREVIELTVGDVYKGKKLHLLVLRTGDYVTNKAVKSYRYLTLNNDGITRIDNWTFNIQGGKMKLESAELHDSGK